MNRGRMWTLWNFYYKTQPQSYWQLTVMCDSRLQVVQQQDDDDDDCGGDDDDDDDDGDDDGDEDDI